MIGIESEIIERAEADSVGVLILRKSFRVPSDRASVLHNSPRHAAVTLIVEGAIVCPGGLLARRMKPNVRDVYSGSQRHAEGLDRAVEVLVVQRVFIVPDASGRIGHFVTHEPDAIVSRIRLLLIYRCACPSRDGRVHSRGRANWGK